MTRKEAKKLHKGDQVFWNDPDEGTCSRTLTICTIQINEFVATIMEESGSVVECFLSELE